MSVETAQSTNKLQVVWINSAAELRAAAAEWDDLWERSDVTSPTARAELVAQWVEQFAPAARFRAIVVEHEGKWVAALPLVESRIRRVLSAGILPVNAWSSGGGFLLDSEAGCPSAVDVLLSAARELPWQLLWLDFVRLNSPACRALREGVARAGMNASVHKRYDVGVLTIDHDWETYRKSWSRKHRQGISKAARHLGQAGEAKFTLYSALAPADSEQLLRQAFEVEDRSWKGANGSSVLRRGMFPYIARQARQLAAWGQLQVACLELKGSIIAFGYGMGAKGVYHSCKIGYDPEYSELRPGHVLRHFLLEELFRSAEYSAFDFVGELSEASRCWRPGTYSIGEVLIAPRRLLGRLTVAFHRSWWPHVRRLKARLCRCGCSATENGSSQQHGVTGQDC